MSPVLGIIASSNQQGRSGGPSGVYDSLATVTLSATTSSITFAGIPAGYKDLQIAGLSRVDTGGVNDVTGYLRFNGDSGSNYSTHRMYGYGAGGGGSYDASASTTQISFSSSAEGGNTANCFSVVVCDILDYAYSNKFKTTISLTGFETNAYGDVFQTSGQWRSYSPVSSITLSASTGSFVANTTFALYGVK